jgi:hypothetical protein
MEYQVNGFEQPATMRDDGSIRFGTDANMNVVFYTRVVHDPEESAKRGMPFSKPATYVRIQQPGERDTVDRPVKEVGDDAVRRFPRQWQAFQAGKAPVPQGTPLEVLFPQAPEIPVNLHLVGVHTVQQLANLTAHGMETIGMGATMWKQKAVEFLKAAEGSAGFHKLDVENQKLKNMVEVQGNQLSLMKMQLDALLAAQNGVPPAMIPTVRPTVAQASFTSHDDNVDDAEAHETRAPIGSDPLFDEPPESYGDDAPASPATEAAPRRRGRPPKIRNEEIA